MPEFFQEAVTPAALAAALRAALEDERAPRQLQRALSQHLICSCARAARRGRRRCVLELLAARAQRRTAP